MRSISTRHLALVLPLPVLFSTSLVAQTQPPDAPVLEEVIVTAEKKAASMQDTPISIAVFGREQIENLRVQDITDLGSFVPNMQQTPHPSSSTSPLITIRGIGSSDNQITQDPSVAIYVDGVYVARNQGMAVDVAELERVEVLRGPQGTLYGRNATGGAINFITRKPSRDAVEFDATLTAGNRDALEGKIAANIPVGENFAGRLSFMARQQDGPVRNAGTGEDTFGAEDRQAMRADLRWLPTEALDVRCTFDRSEIAGTSPYIAYTPRLPGSPAFADPPTRPSSSSPAVSDFRPNDIAINGHSLTVDWKLSPGVALKSISSYRELDDATYQDFMSGRAGPTDPAALISSTAMSHDQWSQEFQLLGSAFSDRLEYLLGLYYFEEEADGLGKAHIPASGVDSLTFSDIHNKAFAAYVQGTYTPRVLQDRLGITLGGRWSRDTREAGLTQQVAFQGFVISESSATGDDTFTDFNPSLVVAYDVNDSANVYAKVVEGYKSGGYNVRASSVAAFERGFGPEQVLSYELGLKSEWWARRLRLNAAAFYTDFDDMQVTLANVANPTTADTLNAGTAIIQGAEIDVTAQLTNNLMVALGYGYLDVDYKKIIDEAGVNHADDYRQSIPAHTYNAQVTYEFPATPIGAITGAAVYSWQSDSLNIVRTQGDYEYPGYGLLDARLTLSAIPGFAKGELSIALWGKNLTDEEYWTRNYGLFGGYLLWGEPRSYGLDVTYRFN